MPFFPTYPEKVQSAVSGALPWVWSGVADRDGDAAPWIDAPAGSLYVFLNGGTAATLYFKEAMDDDDADWQDLTLTE